MKGTGWHAQGQKELGAYIPLFLFCRQLAGSPPLIKFVCCFLFIQLQKVYFKTVEIVTCLHWCFWGNFLVHTLERKKLRKNTLQAPRKSASIQSSYNWKTAVCTYSEETIFNLTWDVSLYFIHFDPSRTLPSLSALYYGQLYQE